MNYPKRAAELRVATTATRVAGNFLKKRYRREHDVKEKTPRELVTVSDIVAQEIIIDTLSRAFPSYKVITEEAVNKILSPSPTWVIDPLDGTNNFVFGIPLVCVSVGLVENRKRVLGVIYAPLEQALYTAVRGHGSFRNGTQILASKEKRLAHSVIAYDNRFSTDSRAFKGYERLVRAAFTTRIFGSATRDLCFVAEGAIAGRVFSNARLYDIAAGTLIVEEAGGVVTDLEGRPASLGTKQIVASNGILHNRLIKILTGTA